MAVSESDNEKMALQSPIHMACSQALLNSDTFILNINKKLIASVVTWECFAEIPEGDWITWGNVPMSPHTNPSRSGLVIC